MSKKSGPILAWVIFHKIAEVYLDVKKLETTTAHNIVTNENIPMVKKDECVADDDRVVGVLVEINESESKKVVVVDGDGLAGVQLVMIKKEQSVLIKYKTSKDEAKKLWNNLPISLLTLVTFNCVPSKSENGMKLVLILIDNSASTRRSIKYRLVNITILVHTITLVLC